LGGLNHLHFITASTYRRARLFDSDRFRRDFVATLTGLRAELSFKVIGYVLMPEHFHALIWPSERVATARSLCRGHLGQTRYDSGK
jgi:REP element-mobilizing transposase RayT